MHGIGNDYLFFNCLENKLDNPHEVSVKLSDRHTGVGSDGIVLIEKSNFADAKMRIFNADGSEGKMCGNAIRCVGKYLFERGIVKKFMLDIETLSGIRHLWLNIQKNKVRSVRSSMGKADFSPEAVGLSSEKEYIDREVMLSGNAYNITAVSIGNPHAVIFVDDTDKIDIEKVGKALESSPLFSDGVNTEFVQILSQNRLKMRVWERGSGETRACGTGACAAVAVSARLGLIDTNTPITVELDGGDLSIECTKNFDMYMTGNAEYVCDVTIEDFIL